MHAPSMQSLLISHGVALAQPDSVVATVPIAPASMKMDSKAYEVERA